MSHASRMPWLMQDRFYMLSPAAVSGCFMNNTRTAALPITPWRAA
jgi:hypothetical protein